MDLDTEKILGYILLLIGIICIIFAVSSLYRVFTNVTEPPEIFKTKSFTFLISPGGNNPSAEITFPLDSEIRKIVNMFLYYIFMFLIAEVGSKISALGIRFIKEIKMVMK